MFKALLTKTKESLFSVLPVAIIVVALFAFGLVKLSTTEIVTFVICSLFLVGGIALFTMGADMAMTPMGEHMGGGLIKKRRLTPLLALSLLVGILITIAEPDLWVLAKQVKTVINDWLLIVGVGIGVGLFLTIGVVKIVFKKDLPALLMCAYMILFALATFLLERGNGHYLAMAFDSGGVTTGPITVPFIMAFGVGIAGSLGGRNKQDNSFGLIALCSVGPILAVLLLSTGADSHLAYTLTDYSITSFLSPIQFFKTLGGVVLEVTAALSLVLLFFIVLQFTVLKLPKKTNCAHSVRHHLYICRVGRFSYRSQNRIYARWLYYR